jgi:hypothetical protein
MLSHEEVSSAEAEPTLSIQKPSLEPEDLEESLQPSDLPPYEDEVFKDFGNTSNYSSQKKPLVPNTPVDPLDEGFLEKTSMNR